MPELLDIRFSYYCRTTHMDKEGKNPIILRITFNGMRRNLFTGLYCLSEDWDRQETAVLKTDKASIAKNRNLQLILRRAHDGFDALRYSGEPFNIDQLVDRLKGREEEPERLIDLLQEGIAKIQKRVGVDITLSSYYKYRRSLEYMKEFLLKEYKVKNFTLNKVNFIFSREILLFLEKT